MNERLEDQARLLHEAKRACLESLGQQNSPEPEDGASGDAASAQPECLPTPAPEPQEQAVDGKGTGNAPCAMDSSDVRDLDLSLTSGRSPPTA
mmetsp:Transcript_3505/g.9495  ORF Transcript_3505/g.9495 Transcript_3505/m.9495 type:complete len:93 (-) Transcript_3505:331-609(-)